MRISLKVKLVLSFLILISLPISILGAISYNMASKALQSAIEQQLEEVALLSSESIGTSVENIKGILKIAAQNNLLISALTEKENLQIEKTAFDYIKVFRHQIINVETVYLVDKQGVAIFTDATMDTNENISDRKYFQDALGGRVIVSDVMLSKTSKKPVITIAQPITSYSQVIGVLAVEVSFNNISKHAEEIVVGKNGYAYMIDKTGLFVYHPDKERILKENIKDIKSVELQVLASKMLEGQNSNGFYTYKDERRYERFLPAGDWILVLSADYQEYMEPAIKIGRSTLLLGVTCVISAMLIAYYISTFNILKPVKRLQQLMSKAGEGDLSIFAKIQTGDEIEDLAKSFNHMIRNQGEIVLKVKNASRDVAASAEEMAVSTVQIGTATEQINMNTQGVAEGAAQQKSSIYTASKVLGDLSELVKQAKDKADDANQNAAATMNTANNGRNKVHETIKAIDAISTTTQETFDVLNILDHISNQIGNIIGTINGIAEKTNLLALNAAIEAARAGEHGKGFAVVADEVRKLSEQSNKGAREIALLVNKMIEVTQRAVKSINEEMVAVENGAKIAEQTDAAFIEIIAAVEGIAKNIQEIGDITVNGVVTSNQVVKLIHDAAQITENNFMSSQEVASSVQEQNCTIQTLASSAEEISTLACTLEELAMKFKIRT